MALSYRVMKTLSYIRREPAEVHIHTLEKNKSSYNSPKTPKQEPVEISYHSFLFMWCVKLITKEQNYYTT